VNVALDKDTNMSNFTLPTALKALESEEFNYKELFSHGTLSIEIYKPELIDDQEPHDQDEVYVIASGTGQFVNGQTRHRFAQGDVLFVPAEVIHRFEDFSSNFSTWVIFYGPTGGETA
jgi:mannose-6-phosphate isomerase-like protein (cupin superfamily)